MPRREKLPPASSTSQPAAQAPPNRAVSLQSVAPSNVKYELSTTLIDDGVLSALKLEAMPFPCQQHEMYLQDEKGAAVLGTDTVTLNRVRREERPLAASRETEGSGGESTSTKQRFGSCSSWGDSEGSSHLEEVFGDAKVEEGGEREGNGEGEGEGEGEEKGQSPDSGVGCDGHGSFQHETVMKSISALVEGDDSQSLVGEKTLKLLIKVNEETDGGSNYVVIGDVGIEEGTALLAALQTYSEVVMTGRVEEGSFRCGDLLYLYPNRIPLCVMSVLSMEGVLKEEASSEAEDDSSVRIHLRSVIEGRNAEGDVCNSASCSNKERRSFRYPVEVALQTLTSCLGKDPQDNYPLLVEAIEVYREALQQKCDEISQWESKWRARKHHASSALQKVEKLLLRAQNEGLVPLLTAKLGVVISFAPTPVCLSDCLSVSLKTVGLVGDEEDQVLREREDEGVMEKMWQVEEANDALRGVRAALRCYPNTAVVYSGLSDVIADYMLSFRRFVYQRREATTWTGRCEYESLVRRRVELVSQFPNVLLSQLQCCGMSSGVGVMKFVHETVFSFIPGYSESLDRIESLQMETKTAERIELKWITALKCSKPLRMVFQDHGLNELNELDVAEVAEDTWQIVTKTARQLTEGGRVPPPWMDCVPIYYLNLKESNKLFLSVLCKGLLQVPFWYFDERIFHKPEV